MGIVEILERQRSEEKARRARIEEEKLQGDELIRAQRLVDFLEQEKQRELRIKSLQDSVVPEMAGRLRAALKGHDYQGLIYPSDKGSEGYIKIYLDTRIINGLEYGFNGNNNREETFISIEGIEDGSIRIGEVILNADDAKNREIVDEALTVAYRSPSKRLYLAKDTPSQPMTPGGP